VAASGTLLNRVAVAAVDHAVDSVVLIAVDDTALNAEEHRLEHHAVAEPTD
jgi:hypothetical protein